MEEQNQPVSPNTIKDYLTSSVDSRDEATKVASREAGAKIMEGLDVQERILSSLLAHGCRLVGNVEVATVSEEISAVTNEESEEAKWRKQLEDDAQTTQTYLGKIENGWKDTEALVIPEELQFSLENLRRESGTLVDKKKELIDSLKKQLVAVDESFSNERLKQTNQRSLILDRVTEHVLELVRAYRTSIREIQSTADASQMDLLNYFYNEVTKASEELNRSLLQMMKLKRDKRLSRKEELMRLQVHGTDSDSVTSSTSRMDIDKVLLELYRVNSRKRIESEQLGFNLEVLREQLKETTTLVSEGRRRVNALRPLVLQFQRKWEALESERSRNSRFKLDQILRKKDQLSSAKSRLNHFMVQSRARLRGITYMHYNHLHDHVMKIHELEKSINLSVLSREFQSDEDYQLLRELHPALKPEDNPALAAASRIFDAAEELSSSDSDSNEEALLEEMFLRQMTNTANFLVDPVHGVAPEERHSLPLLMLEQIFWELGIHNEWDITTILGIAKRKFFQRNKEPFDRLREQWQSDEVFTVLEKVFPAEEVLTTLSEFFKERGKAEQEDRVRELESPRRDSLSPMMDVKRWNLLVHQTTEQRNKTWKIIRDSLNKYHSILTSRLAESTKVETLRQENEELMYLLFEIAFTFSN